MMTKNIYNPKIKDIILEDIIGLDTEFSSLDASQANLSVISINCPIQQINYALDVNSNVYNGGEIYELLEKIKSCKIVLAHNAKADLGVINSNFNILFRNFWCTMLASQLIDNGFGYTIKKESLGYTEYANHPDKIYFTENMVGNIPMMPSPHGLHGCLRRYLGINLSETIDKHTLRMSFVGLPKGKKITKAQLEYACSDVEYLYQLYLKQLEYIKERKQEVQVILENKLTPVLVKMERKGVEINQEKHKENIANWKQELNNIELALDAIIVEIGKDIPALRGGIYSNKRVKQEVVKLSLFAGFEQTITNENLNNVNYGSSQQLAEIFKRAGEELPIDDAGKVSFGEEPIKFFITNYPESKLKKFLEVLLDYREYSKLLSTYGENLLQLLDKNGRMRTNYTQCFTDTGRLTSSAVIKDELGLNLANLPKRNDVRAIFIPDSGYSFVDSDMTGQELMIVGGYSQEETLLKAFKEGFDHHSHFASISYSIIFGKEIQIKNKKEEITVGDYTYDIKKLRDNHKNCIFAKIYLGGPKRIQAVLNEYLVKHVKSEERYRTCEKVSKSLDAAMPKLMNYLKSKVEQVQKHGYVETTFYNRRRYFDNPDKAFGDAANFEIQATGAMAIKTALINIDKFLIEKSAELGIDEEELGWISMSIYDQNLVCMNDKYIELASEIQKIMAKSLTAFLIGLEGASDLNITKKWQKG